MERLRKPIEQALWDLRYVEGLHPGAFAIARDFEARATGGNRHNGTSVRETTALVLEGLINAMAGVQKATEQVHLNYSKSAELNELTAAALAESMGSNLAFVVGFNPNPTPSAQK
jgi:hypothetical protein